jgi:hypothetical protein
MATNNSINNQITSANFTVSAGLISLPTTSSTVGQITLNGNRFLHGYGTDNVFLGTDAGNFTLTSTGCVCIGRDACKGITSPTNAVIIGNKAANGGNVGTGAISIGYQTGGSGTYIGYQSGYLAGAGHATSVGYQAYAATGSGCNYTSNNSAFGYRALYTLGSGSAGNSSANTSFGSSVLSRLTEGSGNTAIGLYYNGGGWVPSGYNYTGYESYNICINSAGVTGDLGKLRIGDQVVVTSAYVAGIYNYTGTIGTTGTAAVIIDSAGQIQSAHAFGANANCKTVSLIKSRGTSATPTVITANDALGIIDFRGHDGTAYIVGSQITSTNSGTVATNRIASDLKFYTHPDSTTSSTLRMTIAPTGGITIAAPDSGTGLTVSGGGATITDGNATVTSGNLVLTAYSAASVGVIKLATMSIHNSSSDNNTFVGNGAGTYTFGYGGNSPGNSGFGYGTLSSLANSGALYNSGFGYWVMNQVSTGSYNVGMGYKVAFNQGAATGLTTGSYNVLLGYLSGYAYTGSESSNIIINNVGVVGESNKIRIGTQGSGNSQQNACYIAGIYGVTPGGTKNVAYVDSNGQLGSVAVLPPAYGGKIPVTECTTSNTVTLVADNAYIATSTDGATKVVFTMPASAAVGTIIQVTGKSSAFWEIDQIATTNQIHMGATSTTANAAGKITTAQQWASVTMMCTTADTDWVIISTTGTIVLA